MKHTVKLMHSKDEIHVIKIKESEAWRTWDRLKRNVYFLSNGNNSSHDIATILKIRKENVQRSIACLYFEQYVTLLFGQRYAIRVFILQKDYAFLAIHSHEFSTNFYTLLVNKSIHVAKLFQQRNITGPIFENQCMIFVKFLVDCSQQNNALSVLEEIVSGYQLVRVEAIYIQFFLDTFLLALAQTLKRETIHKDWEHISCLVKYALFFIMEKNSM